MFGLYIDSKTHVLGTLIEANVLALGICVRHSKRSRKRPGIRECTVQTGQVGSRRYAWRN